MPDIDILLKSRATGVGDIDKTSKAIDKADKSVGKYNVSYKSMLKTVIGTGAILMGARKAWNFLKESITLATEQEAAVKQLETTIASTGGAAGLTSIELQHMASSLQGVTTYGDETIIRAQALMLTFKNIGKDIFPRATEAILDTATAMKLDLKSATVQIGKVMNDPIANLSALTRQGIQFSEAQKTMIKEMQKSGNLMGAQRIILKELESQFGGSARAAADTFGGAMTQASNIIGDAQELLAKEFMPILKGFAKWVSENKDFIAGAFRGIGKAIKFAFGPIAAISYISQLKKQSRDLVDTHRNAADSVKLMKERFLAFGKQAHEAGLSVQPLIDGLENVGKDAKDANDTFADYNELMAKIKAGKYGEALQEEFIKFNAEFVKTISLQKEGAAVTGELTNGIDKEKKEVDGATKALEEHNVIIPETLEIHTRLSDMLEHENDAWKEGETVIEGMSHALEMNAQQTEEAQTAFEELEKAQKSAELQTNLLIIGLDSLGDLTGIPQEMASGFKAMAGMISYAASGNVLGVLATGISLISSLFSGGKKSVQKSIFAAAEELEKFAAKGSIAIDKTIEKVNELIDSLDMAGKSALGLGSTMADLYKKILEGSKEAAAETKEYWESAFDIADPLKDYLAGGAANQKEFNAQVNITMGTMASMLKSGASIVEVMDAMGESFDQLAASQAAGNYEGNDLFETLKKFRTLVKDNEELVKSVEGYNKTLEMTASLAPLTAGQVKDFATGATAQYDKLIEAGFSSNQALTMIGPSLLTLKENAERLGVSLDANTQKLVDQAEQSGVFEGMANPLDTIANILERILQQLGGEMPPVVDNFGKTAATAATSAGKEFEKMSGEIGSVGSAMADNFKKGTSLANEHIELLVQEGVKKLNDLNDAAKIDFKIKSSLPGPGPVPPPKQYQAGTQGWLDVPPGHRRDDYLVALRTGERYNVQPSAKGGAPGGGKTEIHIHTTGASKDEIARSFVEAYKSNHLGMKTETTG